MKMQSFISEVNNEEEYSKELVKILNRTAMDMLGIFGGEMPPEVFEQLLSLRDSILAKLAVKDGYNIILTIPPKGRLVRDVYDDYLKRCAEKKQKPMNRYTFGKEVSRIYGVKSKPTYKDGKTVRIYQ